MAKSKSSSKKKSGASQTAHLSPAEFLRTKARTLPLGKCYIGVNRDNPTQRQAIVTRLRPSGNIAAGLFLIDTWCFGLTDAFCQVNLTPAGWEDLFEEMREEFDLLEKPYPEVHNLIYSAIEFAEEDGLPIPDTFDLVENILEEDNDSIPLIPYNLGLNGKHHLEISKYDEATRNSLMQLKARLGDKFEYTITDPDYTAHRVERKHFPSEPFSYDYPEYPATLDLKHPEIEADFLSPDNLFDIPQETKDLILSLPPDEAASDLGSILLYTIGSTYRDIMENPDEAIPDGSIVHSLIFLSAIKSGKALGALIELLHQSDDFMEAHLGDFATTALPQALATALGDNPEQIITLLDTPGLPSFNRFYIIKALAIMADRMPELRSGIIELMRKHLQRVATDLADTRACDSEYVGLMMPLFDDLNAIELKPEIKAVFDTGLVDTSVCGTFDDLFTDDSSSPCEIRTLTIDEYYNELERSRKISLGEL